MGAGFREEVSVALGAMRRMLGDTKQLKGWYWLTASTALILIIPWLLYFSDIVFTNGDSSLGKIPSLLSFTFMSFVTLAVLCGTKLLDKIRSAGMSAFALTAFVLGIALLVLGSVPATASFRSALSTIFLQLIGGAACSAGYTVLLVRWVSIPYSKMSRDQAIMVICLGGCAAASVYLFLILISFPSGSVVLAGLAIAVFSAAHRAKCDGHPASTGLVSSISKAGEFVMQNGGRPKAVMAVCSFSFGFELSALLAEGAFSHGFVQHAWPAMLLGLLAIAAAMALSFGRGQSILLNLLMASILMSIVGALLTCFAELDPVGSLFLMAGFFVLTTFYLVFFSAVSQRKDASGRLILGIFRRTLSIIPLATLCAIVAYWVLSKTAPQHVYLMGALECLAMVLVIVSMLTSELTNTRQELSQKTESTIALSDVRAFAAGEGSSYGLTERECEVIHMLMSGRSASAAAKELYLSANTVKTHTRSIYRKLGVHNRQEMIDLVAESLRS